MYNGNYNTQNGNYISDYPQVFFTSDNVTNNNLQNNMQPNGNSFNNNGFLSNILNSDMLKQILPFLLGGKTNNNTNFMSIMQNFNPNISKIISSLGIFNNKNDRTITDNKNNDKNIIDMNGYEEIDNN